MRFFQFVKNLFQKRITKKIIRTRWKEKENYKRPYLGVCESLGCQNKPSGLDVYCCKYCSKYHCPKHRLPEEHNCTGKPISPPKKDVINYPWHDR